MFFVRLLLFILSLYPFGVMTILSTCVYMLALLVALPIMLMGQSPTEPISTLTEKYGLVGFIIAGLFGLLMAVWLALQKERDSHIADLNKHNQELAEGFEKITTSITQFASALDRFSAVMGEALQQLGRVRDGR